MYTPTVSRGSKHSDLLEHAPSSTCALPSSTVKVDADAGNGSSETLGKDAVESSVSPDSNPPSLKSFTARQADQSSPLYNTHCPQNISFLFPLRNIDCAPPKCVTATSSGVEVQPHDVIGLSNMSSRAYPPGSASTPVVSGTQSSHQRADGEINSNHDDNGPKGIAYRVASGHMGGGIHSVHPATYPAIFGHLQSTDHDISHVAVNKNGGRKDLAYPQGSTHPISGTEDKDTNNAATGPLESADPESVTATTSFFGWLF